MDDPRMAAWAEVLVGYCVAVQPGPTVSISGGVAAEPLLRAIYRAVIDHGWHHRAGSLARVLRTCRSSCNPWEGSARAR